jgi:hypothetical protein
MRYEKAGSQKSGNIKYNIQNVISYEILKTMIFFKLIPLSSIMVLRFFLKYVTLEAV